MPAIKLLSESTIRKIAAGEVVEGPASVVKELIENALDAGASRVSAQVVEGGIEQIEIADDGHGMSRDDALLAMERHATSKIAAASDLFGIDSLGFRGEALASIAAVSRLRLETRLQGEDEGTLLAIEGGVQRQLRPCARDVGTTISVRGLFFNTPARRKFLRLVSTEMRHITTAAMQLAAAYPKVDFTLTSQDRRVLDLRSGSRLARAADLLNQPEDSLSEGEYETGGVAAHVIVCAPEHCRRTRGGQYIVVRDRPVQSRTIARAVYSGYGGLIRDEHPLFAVWIELPSRQVDVNVHPAKKEVRFADEEQCAAVVTAAVRNALRLPDAFAAATPALTSAGASAPPLVAEPTPEFKVTPSGDSDAVQTVADLLPPSGTEGPSRRTRTVEPEAEADKEQARVRLRGRTVWQLHSRYLLLPTDDSLILIDRRLAHERVLYERALASFEKGDPPPSQQLLLPLTLDLDARDMETVERAGPMLQEIGFQVRPFGPGSAILDAAPPELAELDRERLFRQLLARIAEAADAEAAMGELIAAEFARGAAVSPGRVLAAEEAQALVEQLFSTAEPFRSPDGTPTMAKMTMDDLDRLFRTPGKTLDVT